MMRRILKPIFLVFFGFYIPSYSAMATSSDMPLISHRAIYAVQLDRANSKSSINDLSGRIVYEFNAPTCGGFTTNFRLVTRIDMEGIPSQLNDQRSTSFESADGKQFRFLNQSYTDQELTKDIEGVARHEAKKIIIEISKPQAQQHELPYAPFPTWHMLDLIKRAENGENFYKIDLYDGSDDATKISQTVVVIGQRQHKQKDEADLVMSPHAQDPFWPVTISYFDDNQNRDGLPIYRTSFLLYKNGITRDLLMDYGDFSLRGELVQLDLLDQNEAAENCPALIDP